MRERERWTLTLYIVELWLDVFMSEWILLVSSIGWIRFLSVQGHVMGALTFQKLGTHPVLAVAWKYLFWLMLFCWLLLFKSLFLCFVDLFHHWCSSTTLINFNTICVVSIHCWCLLVFLIVLIIWRIYIDFSAFSFVPRRLETLFFIQWRWWSDLLWWWILSSFKILLIRSY